MKTDRTYTTADLKDAATAIAFALSRLELWEVPMFLKDWTQGADLEPWLAGPREWLEAQAAQ